MKTQAIPQILNLRLSSADEVDFSAAAAAPAARRFSGIANSGRPFGLGSWQSVIDFDGIRLKDKTGFLVDHDTAKRAGAGSLKVTSDGLLAEGVLLDNEHGRAVAAESDQGFPWEMSVYVQAGSVEELQAGVKATVNGRELAGPMLIMRKCAIREVSFTAVGRDAGTHAVVLSESGEPTEFDYQPRKQERLSMTPEEKAEFEQLRADKARLEKENADLKLSAHTAHIDAKLSAAGFEKGEDGKFAGVSAATYTMLLSADADAAAAVIADLKPADKAKPAVPEALLSDPLGEDGAADNGVKLAAAMAKGSFGGSYV